MFRERIRKVMKKETMLTAAPETTVGEAARLMARSGVGAILVVEGEVLVGIFTERDALFRVVALGSDARTTRLVEVMTPEPLTVDPDRTFGHALQLMHKHGFRHVPVVEDGRPIGVVTARDALGPELEDFVLEMLRQEQVDGVLS